MFNCGEFHDMPTQRIFIKALIRKCHCVVNFQYGRPDNKTLIIDNVKLIILTLPLPSNARNCRKFQTKIQREKREREKPSFS